MIEIHHINGRVLYTAKNAQDIRSALEEACKKVPILKVPILKVPILKVPMDSILS